MDDEQYGRYFFIDTKPSEEKFQSTNHQYHPEESRDYESDHIDEEIEHRLYSMIHHHHSVDDNVVDPRKDDESKSENNHQQHVSPSNHDSVNNEQAIQLNGEGDKQIICDNILINLNNKRRKKLQPISPNSKKAKPSTSTATTSSTSNINVPSVKQNNHHQQQPSIIYLSDSDEDTITTVEDVPEINVTTVTATATTTSSSTAKRDLWHIDYKDYLIANPVHGKFYRPRIWCSRCKKEGNHPVKLCHLPKHKICYICGSVGHLGQHCQNQHCKRCMDFHSTSHCNLNVREYKCRICSKYGHLDDVCPNHWRKFHAITDPQIDPSSTTTQIQKNTNKSCSICGRHQHYSFECDRLRNRSIEISSPYDINTTFGGKIYPIVKKKPPTTPIDIYQRFHQQELRTTPQSTKFFSRRSRYFTGESNHSIVDQPNTSGHSNMNQVVPSPSPQSKHNHNLNHNFNHNNFNHNSNNNNNNNNNNIRSPKKKPKTRKKKNKQLKMLADNEMIKREPIRAGKVKKPKTRQQQRKKQKKQYLKMQQQFMRRQSVNQNWFMN